MIVVLKELEDVDLVKGENLENEARDILEQLSQDTRLGDPFFAEVRFRIIRATAELRFENIARRRALNPMTWERKTWILLLGALQEATSMPYLASIGENRREPFEIREAAIKAISSYRIDRVYEQLAQLLTVLPGVGEIVLREQFGPSRPPQGVAEEIVPLWPRRGKVTTLKSNQFEVQQAAKSLLHILSDKGEQLPLRQLAVDALGHIGNETNLAGLESVFFDEWNTLGDEVIDSLSRIGINRCIAIFQRIVLAQTPSKTLRLKAVTAIEGLGSPAALMALREIVENSREADIQQAARTAAGKVEAKSKRFAF
jgi:hypothetical protein